MGSVKKMEDELFHLRNSAGYRFKCKIYLFRMRRLSELDHGYGKKTADKVDSFQKASFALRDALSSYKGKDIRM